MATTNEVIIQEWPYRTEEVTVVPYVPRADNGFPEYFLVELYTMTRKDDLFRRAFPGSPEFNLNGFISYFNTRTMIVGMKRSGEVIGYSWIYEVDGSEQFKKASIGFVMFKRYWGESFLYDLARLGVSWFFKEAGINILYATIGAWNRPSVRFARILGFEVVGRAPMFFMKDGAPISVDICCMKREEFLAKGLKVLS